MHVLCTVSFWPVSIFRTVLFQTHNLSLSWRLFFYSFFFVSFSPLDHGTFTETKCCALRLLCAKCKLIRFPWPIVCHPRCFDYSMTFPTKFFDDVEKCSPLVKRLVKGEMFPDKLRAAALDRKLIMLFRAGRTTFYLPVIICFAGFVSHVLIHFFYLLVRGIFFILNRIFLNSFTVLNLILFSLLSLLIWTTF